MSSFIVMQISNLLQIPWRPYVTSTALAGEMVWGSNHTWIQPILILAHIVINTVSFPCSTMYQQHLKSCIYKHLVKFAVILIEVHGQGY